MSGVYDRVAEELAEDDVALELLADIRDAVTDDAEESYFEYGYSERTPGESDSGTVEAVYSYLQDKTAGTDWNRITLPVVADTVVVRKIGDDLDLALKDPNGNDDAIIPLTSSDSPFVISGVYGIQTQRVYLRQSASAGGAHTVDILGVKRRGN